MPPPSVVNAWLIARRFGVVIDAGSSGSRLQIYSWKDPRVAQQQTLSLDVLPRVEKGTQEGDGWVTKVEPGLSSFADNVEGVPSYLAPLLDYAMSHIPPSLHAETPLFLLATAGMRLLTPLQQGQVLQATCTFLRFHSHFKIEDGSLMGPCGSSVRIITGEEEGLFGWIAVNYLMDGFTGSQEDRTTYGFLDMGGASTQIAFEPSKEEREKPNSLIDVRLRLLSGREIHHEVFVTTWLGYGTNQARERYVGQVISEYETTRVRSPSADIIPDPCLPKDLLLTEYPIQPGLSTSHTRQPHVLLGTGSFEQCLKQTSPLLHKDAPCPDTHCLFNGVHTPPIDFSSSHFIGVSEYWYSSEHVFGLGGSYDFVQYERAASDFCARDWSHIVAEHEESRQQGHLGGDGEVEHKGEIVSTGKWGDKVEISRLQMQCFKAAWIVNVLHEGIGMPRIVDPGGNGTTNGEKVVQQAQNKGLGRPTFQSLDSVGDIAISWTLGKMVLEASKAVPPLSKTARPLGDPLDDLPNTDESPVQPIRPMFLDFNTIEDHISHHLPSSLTRHTLGFSPIGFLFYMVSMLVFVAVGYRLRHQVRNNMRRFIRKRDYISDSYLMEEGYTSKDGIPLSPQRPSSPATRFSFKLFRPLKHLSSSLSRTHRPSPISLNTVTSLVEVAYPTSPSRVPPKTQNGVPLQDATNGLGSSYAPGSPRLLNGSIVSNGSVASLSSRSRNSSQMNLSIAPRQAISRSTSGNSSSFRDE